MIAAIGTDVEAAFKSLLLEPLVQLFSRGDDSWTHQDTDVDELLVLMDAVDEAESSSTSKINAMLHLLTCANGLAMSVFPYVANNVFSYDARLLHLILF